METDQQTHKPVLSCNQLRLSSTLRAASLAVIARKAGRDTYRTFLPPRQPARANENTNLRYPQVVCIISRMLWLPFYFKVQTCATTCCDSARPPSRVRHLLHVQGPAVCRSASPTPHPCSPVSWSLPLTSSTVARAAVHAR